MRVRRIQHFPCLRSGLRLTIARVAAIAFLAVLPTLAGCGGGGGGGSSGASGAGGGTRPPAPPDPTPSEAARFLNQATFGATHDEIAKVQQIGYAAWLDEQMDDKATPMTLMLPYILQQLEIVGNAPGELRQPWRRNAWLWFAAKNPDQLRMRMGFALSEIMVVSDVSSGNIQVPRIADYQDTLARGAFGSFRDLLTAVSLHPAMGEYLSHAGNQKATADGKVVPDENYGREVMQLFSIGLSRRNPDFSLVLDDNGNPVPTYDQSVISAMARVFTGWTYKGLTDREFEKGRINPFSYEPMECHPAFHDNQPKQIFDGIVIDNGDDCVADLEDAMDALSEHPSTAPFISRQLIQRFVTSNPSPQYIARVVTVWNDTDGNLGAVLRAILLDTEARTAPAANDSDYGKAREPLVRIINLWRSYEARYVVPADGPIRFLAGNLNDLTLSIAQDSLRSPSVFNFFQPDYRIPTNDDTVGRFAPELQIVNESTFSTGHNQTDAVLWNYAGTLEPAATTAAPLPDISALVALADAGNYAGMVDDVNLLLFADQMSAATEASLVSMLTQLRDDNRSSSELARSLLLLALASPEYAIQR